MFDLDCPYCGVGQYVCHDDGQGYEEGRLHEQQCDNCDKVFTFETSISFYYEPYKADCLNGAEHNWQKPKQMWFDEQKQKALWSRKCSDCEKREQGYNPEWMEEE